MKIPINITVGADVIRPPWTENIDDKYVDYLNEKYTGVALKEALYDYYEGLKKDESKWYRIDIRPLWKNNEPRVYGPLANQIAAILGEESGNPPWYEETTKCFKFQLNEEKISMKTIIALQAIGHNNGGYCLGISRVL